MDTRHPLLLWHLVDNGFLLAESIQFHNLPPFFGFSKHSTVNIWAIDVEKSFLAYLSQWLPKILINNFKLKRTRGILGNTVHIQCNAIFQNKSITCRNRTREVTKKQKFRNSFRKDKKKLTCQNDSLWLKHT